MNKTGFFDLKNRIAFCLFLFCASECFAGYSACVDIFPRAVSGFDDTKSYYMGIIKDWNVTLGTLKVDSHPVVIYPVGYKPPEASSYSPQSGRIELGIKIDPSERYKVSLVLAHEFGHAVFWNHLKIRLNDHEVSLLDYFPVSSENFKNSPYSMRELSKYEEVFTLAKDTGRNEIAEIYLDKIIFLRQELLKSAGTYLMPMQFLNLVSPYSELFSDIIPVALWQDPTIFAKTLESFETREDGVFRLGLQLKLRGRNKHTSVSPRDFRIIPFSGWKKEVMSQYTLFDPLRGTLWPLFLKNMDSSHIEAFLKAYLVATKKHIALRMQRGDTDNPGALVTSPEVLNREFLKIIIDEARKHSVPLKPYR